jgi:hypothetical protein
VSARWGAPDPEDSVVEQIAPHWEGDMLRWRCTTPVWEDRYAWAEAWLSLWPAMAIAAVVLGGIFIFDGVPLWLAAAVFVPAVLIAAACVPLMIGVRATMFGNRHKADYWVGPESAGWVGTADEQRKAQIEQSALSAALVATRGYPVTSRRSTEQRVFKWRHGSKIVSKADEGVILLQRSLLPPIVLRCPGEVFKPVSDAVNKYAGSVDVTAPVLDPEPPADDRY